MADGANSRSVIVYEPATQTVSIRKIRDLGKFDISSFLFSYWADGVRRNEPNYHSTNPQIQKSCEDQLRKLRAWPGTPHRTARPKKTGCDCKRETCMRRTGSDLRDGRSRCTEISYGVRLAWFSCIPKACSADFSWRKLGIAMPVLYKATRDVYTIHGENYIFLLDLQVHVMGGWQRQLWSWWSSWSCIIGSLLPQLD